jgi:formyl-CoA transferase
VPRPQGNTHPQLCPFGIFPASDGYVTIAAPTNHHWRALCDIIGRPELGVDDRYRNVVVRLEHRDDVIAFISEWSEKHTKVQIVAALGGLVPVAPVNDAQDIFGDPHVKARGMLADVEQPGLDRPVTIVDTPIKLTKTPGGVRTRAPLLGEHTDAILRDAGLAPDEIARLREAAVVA